jgi:hypothetical protein
MPALLLYYQQILRGGSGESRFWLSVHALLPARAEKFLHCILVLMKKYHSSNMLSFGVVPTLLWTLALQYRIDMVFLTFADQGTADRGLTRTSLVRLGRTKSSYFPFSPVLYQFPCPLSHFTQHFPSS